MTFSTYPSSASLAPTSERERSVSPSGLAQLYETLLTITARVRAGRQRIEDMDSFRTQMVSLLDQARTTGLEAGYSDMDLKVAEYPVVALIDESVHAQPNHTERWAIRPLQDERYGRFNAGNVVFENIDALLRQGGSRSAADVLEVYLLCLQLGFHGRFGSDETGVQTYAGHIVDFIRRAVDPIGELAPGWRPPRDASVKADPWIRPLVIGFVAMTSLIVIIWAIGTLSLRTYVRAVRDAAPQARTL